MEIEHTKNQKETNQKGLPPQRTYIYTKVKNKEKINFVAFYVIIFWKKTENLKNSSVFWASK